MSKRFEALAGQIVEKVGGPDNVAGLHHCQTRLRFKLKDESIALGNQDEIGALDGVLTVVNQGGMFQVVIGTDVEECYEEVVKLLPADGVATSGDGDDAPAEKQKPFDVVADFVSSIFSPIVPALAGAGMVKALLAFLVAFSLIDNTTQTYQILNLFGDATFAFMPILLAYTTAQKLKCNPIIAAVVAGIMCHPTWTQFVTDGEAVKFFDVIPFYLVRYTGSVIPIVLVLLVQAPIEKWLNKIVPGAIRLVVVPMLEFILMGTLALSVLGPLGDFVGQIFTGAFTFLSENVGWLECMVMGGLYSPLVIFGLHHGLAPLGTMQMADMGYDGIFGPGVLCANIGQGTASLVSGLISRDNKTKQIGISAGVTGLMGTTEPALYGINVPKKYPLVAGMIGGAAGGLFAGLTHTHRYATGSSGLPAVVMYIGDGTMQFFYNILISLGITIVVAAVATVVLKRIMGDADEDKAVAAKAEEAAKAEAAAALPSHVDAADEAGTLTAPMTGTAIDMSTVSDPVFASLAMGKGVAIEPTEGAVYAPVTGTISTCAETGHAIGIVSDDGCEVLLHIGIDTVELEGKPFTIRCKAGDAVKAGDLLMVADLEAIKAAGKDTTTMVIVTNTDDYASVTPTLGVCAAGKPVVKVAK